MGSFICRQPNGLLCRFSTVVDCITDYNMTDEEYIEKCAEQAREDARYRIDRHLLDYSEVDRRFAPHNMSYDEYMQIKEQMEKPSRGYIIKNKDSWCENCKHYGVSVNYCCETCPELDYEGNIINLRAFERRDNSENLRHCYSCWRSKDGHCAGTEECRTCMWKSQYEEVLANDKS